MLVNGDTNQDYDNGGYEQIFKYTHNPLSFFLKSIVVVPATTPDRFWCYKTHSTLTFPPLRAG
jgi:hypothetical protein